MVPLNFLQNANLPLKLELSSMEIESCLNNDLKPDIPNLSSHSQSVERSVKLVLEASYTSYGLESRHNIIVAKVLGRNMRPSFSSKSYYQHCFEELPELKLIQELYLIQTLHLNFTKYKIC